MEINEAEDQFGQLEIDDDFWEDLAVEDTVTEEKEEVEATTEEAEEEEQEEEKIEEQEETEEKSEEEPVQQEVTNQEDNDLSDDSIFEKYGNDVDPTVVRHFEVVKDYLIVDESFEFNGKNIEDAYEMDNYNRNKVLAENLVQQLPDQYRMLLDRAINNPDPISTEVYDYILRVGREQLKNDYDPDDEDSMRAYLRAGLLETGTEESDVDDIIELYSDKGKLGEMAEKYKQKKNQYLEQLKQQELDKNNQIIQQEKEAANEFKNTLNNVIDSTEYKTARKNVIKNYIYGKSRSGDTPLVENLKHIYSNPEALVTLADMISYYDNKTGKWDMSRFEQIAVTKQTKKAKDSIQSKLSGSNALKTIGGGKKRVDFDWNDVDI